MKLQPTLLAIALATLLAACGKADAPEEAESQAPEQAPPAAAAPAAPAPAPNANREITVEDIERWQRGMAAEKKAVQEAAAKLAEAKDDQARLMALNAALETSTLDAGAAAAGVERDAYRRVRATLSEAVAQLSPLELEMDVSKMPPEMVEQFRQGREQGAAQLSAKLPPELFAALKARAAELRQQDKELVGERLKVANAAR